MLYCCIVPERLAHLLRSFTRLEELVGTYQVELAPTLAEELTHTLGHYLLAELALAHSLAPCLVCRQREVPCAVAHDVDLPYSLRRAANLVQTLGVKQYGVGQTHVRHVLA